MVIVLLSPHVSRESVRIQVVVNEIRIVDLAKCAMHLTGAALRMWNAPMMASVDLVKNVSEVCAENCQGVCGIQIVLMINTVK